MASPDPLVDRLPIRVDDVFAFFGFFITFLLLDVEVALDAWEKVTVLRLLFALSLLLLPLESSLLRFSLAFEQSSLGDPLPMTLRCLGACGSSKMAIAIARARRRRRRLARFDPVALLELGPAIVHGLLHVDDPAERILGNFLVLAAAVGGADDPDGLGPAAGSLEEFAGDGTTLVLVLNIIALFVGADVTPTRSTGCHD
eukprot:CAMPEP_0181110438 /NCGR_PEP_ID=MMETSP1071-20121207/18720_1 /TAXON_ID=35127 /ORGANISM="Thalassiosira sp., Strain NH16" /LENGTH=199 /DNA_ID=CAMNT_0023194221 /DNA_START=256 /DNA_END=855 /DNA_ORIENTATION=-